jgi:hypothetical protein
LFQEDVAEEKTFEKILVHWNSNVFKFVVLDSAGNFTQLDRHLNFDTIISLRAYLSDRPTINTENKEAT